MLGPGSSNMGCHWCCKYLKHLYVQTLMINHHIRGRPNHNYIGNWLQDHPSQCKHLIQSFGQYSDVHFQWLQKWNRRLYPGRGGCHAVIITCTHIPWCYGSRTCCNSEDQWKSRLTCGFILGGKWCLGLMNYPHS